MVVISIQKYLIISPFVYTHLSHLSSLETYVCLIDLEKAFDEDNNNIIWQASSLALCSLRTIKFV